MSQMSRRGFLGAMLGAIAIAAAPTLAANAPNKYQKALELYDLAVADRSKPALCNQRFDTLLGYLMDEFPFTYNQETLMEAHRTIPHVDYAGWRRIPPTVSDMLYPIALTKMALTHDKLPLDPGRLTQFDRFHKIYGKAICDATNPLLTKAANGAIIVS